MLHPGSPPNTGGRGPRPPGGSSRPEPPTANPKSSSVRVNPKPSVVHDPEDDPIDWLAVSSTSSAPMTEVPTRTMDRLHFVGFCQDPASGKAHAAGIVDKTMDVVTDPTDTGWAVNPDGVPGEFRAGAKKLHRRDNLILSRNYPVSSKT